MCFIPCPSLCLVWTRPGYSLHVLISSSRTRDLLVTGVGNLGLPRVTEYPEVLTKTKQTQVSPCPSAEAVCFYSSWEGQQPLASNSNLECGSRSLWYQERSLGTLQGPSSATFHQSHLEHPRPRGLLCGIQYFP